MRKYIIPTSFVEDGDGTLVEQVVASVESIEVFASARTSMVMLRLSESGNQLTVRLGPNERAALVEALLADHGNE